MIPADAPRITFAIPFYGEQAYLPAALASLQRLRESTWRAVVVDNAPTPCGAREAVEATGDPRISYERNPRTLPMGANWNRCLEAAETELVTLLHADDELLPGYAEAIRRAADARPGAAGYFCRARTVDAEGEPVLSVAALYKRLLEPRPDSDEGIVIVAGETGARRLLRRNFIVAPTLCFRMSRLAGRRFTDQWRFMTDIEMTLRLVAAGETLVGVPEVHLSYRLHGGSQTSQLNRTLERFREEAVFLAEAAGVLEARGWGRAARVARRRGVTRLHLAFQAAADLARFRVGSAWAKTRLALSLPGAADERRG